MALKVMISILIIPEEINMEIILEMLNTMEKGMMITVPTMKNILMIIMAVIMEIIMDQVIMTIMKHMDKIMATMMDSNMIMMNLIQIKNMAILVIIHKELPIQTISLQHFLPMVITMPLTKLEVTITMKHLTMD